MLLALWSDFWNPADWVQGVTPPPVTAPQSPTNAGHGPMWKEKEYRRADEGYWEAREQSLKAHIPITVSEVVEKQYPEIVPMVAAHNEMVARLPKLPDIESLNRVSTELIKLSLQISRLRVKSDEDALLALLL